MTKIARLVSLGTVVAVVLVLSMVATAQTPTVQIVDDAQYGRILADAAGKTLYTFTNDTAGQASTCVDTCATNWPPLTLASGSPAAPTGLPGTLSTIARTDGTMQVAYDGMPLYTYIGDTAAGQTNGQGVNNVWFVALVEAAATGTPGTPAAEATAAATVEATAAATTAATEAATVAPTTEATSAATVAAQAATTATTQPALPTTGGSGGSWALTIVVLGGLALLAGAGVSVLLQRQRSA